MRYYQLFAARDGDTLVTCASHPDREAAENWARAEITNAFDLDLDESEGFDEVVAETDGVSLEAIEKSSTADAAIEVLRNFLPLHRLVQSHPEIDRSSELDRYVNASRALSLALKKDGYT